MGRLARYETERPVPFSLPTPGWSLSMMPKNSGMISLENLLRMREPTRAVAEPSSSPRGGVPEEDPEYEEVEDLIYERTGTLSFPYAVRIVEGGVTMTRAAVARPATTGAPSAGPESAAWSTLGRIVRDLRSASAGTPGVALLATVDVVGGQPASAAKQREPSTPPCVSEAAKPHGPRTTSSARALTSVPQRVAVGPAHVPPRRSAVVANRAPGKVVQAIDLSPSPPTSRHVAPSRGRDERSSAPVANAQRTTQPSLRTKQRVDSNREREARAGAPVASAQRASRPSLRAQRQARRVYPSFGQRVLAELRRSPLAKRSVASGVLAALVVAGVFVASSTLLPRRVAHGTVAPRSSVAAVDERVPVPALAHGEPHVGVLAAEGGGEYEEVTIDREALETQLTMDRSKEAKAKAHSHRREPTQPRRHEPCDCLPGDPLCGCLD
jgi:hypothetical protein